MNIAGGLIAVRSRDVEGVLAALGFAPTAEGVEAFCATRVRLPSFAVSPDGWIYVLGPFEFVSERSLSRVSRHGETVGCALEDIDGTSVIFVYRDGAELWSAAHADALGDLHLAVSPGAPPEVAERRRERALQMLESSAADMLDLPAELALSICGYRPDGDFTDVPDPGFHRLRRLPSPKPSTPFWPRFVTSVRSGWRTFKAARAGRGRR